MIDNTLMSAVAGGPAATVADVSGQRGKDPLGVVTRSV